MRSEDARPIFLYVHGRGRGHASRARDLAAAFAARGHMVRAFAGPDALPMLASTVTTTAVASLPPRFAAATVSLLARRISHDFAIQRRARPALVVSDGDLPSLCAARLAGISGIAIGHGLVFAACPRPVGLPRAAWWREAIKAAISSAPAATRVAIHFTDLPTRAGWVLARPTVRSWPTMQGRERLVAYFRDGIDASLLAILGSAGHPVDAFAPSGAEGVMAPSPTAFAAAVAHARAVVASAGSQLISECLAHGMPLLAVYDPDDDEQRLNALLLRAAGLGDAVARDRLDAARLRRFLAAAGTMGRSTPSGPDAVAAVLAAWDRMRRVDP